MADAAGRGSSFGGNLSCARQGKGKDARTYRCPPPLNRTGIQKNSQHSIDGHRFPLRVKKNMLCGGPPGIKLKQGRLLMFLVN